jgi:hypothetical protein
MLDLRPISPDMASREQTLTIGSPFKTGFYAGVGFFFASALMSILAALLIGLLGFGAIFGLGGVLSHARSAASPSDNAVQSAYHTSPDPAPSR